MKAVHKNEDIEVLRGVAVIFTVLCHFNDLLTWKGGWTQWFPEINYWGGVDLFFCISGFVIAGSLIRQPRPGSFRDFAVPFYIRRIFRIWPPALFWLGVSLLATIVFNSSLAFGHFRSVLGDATAAALQVANFYYMECTGSCGKEAIYWSLSLEEQFYLIFPLLLFFMRRRDLRYLLIFLILLQLPLHRPVASALWYVRTDAICYGILIAMARDAKLHLHPAFAALRDRHIAAATLAGVLLLTVAVISIRLELKINAGLLAAASACLVWLASYDEDIIIPWRRIRPFLLWTGSRSYSIYLTHEPCFWAVRELVHRTRLNPGLHPGRLFALLVTIGALLLIALASDLTYRLIETPLRKLGRHLADRIPRVGRPPKSPHLWPPKFPHLWPARRSAH